MPKESEVSFHAGAQELLIEIGLNQAWPCACAQALHQALLCLCTCRERRQQRRLLFNKSGTQLGASPEALSHVTTGSTDESPGSVSKVSLSLELYPNQILKFTATWASLR